MKEAVRMALLRIVLRVLSIGFLAAFIPWITLILLNAPILAPGGSLAPLLRFQPYNAAYESMLAAIHMCGRSCYGGHRIILPGTLSSSISPSGRMRPMLS